LALYYHNDRGHEYLVRVAQGLVAAGKGLVSGNPFYSDGFLYSKVSMAGLFIMANAMLDMEHILIEKFNYVIYYLVCAIYPRWLFTVSASNAAR
jgi:26S proteasome regulatory subunit N1